MSWRGESRVSSRLQEASSKQKALPQRLKAALKTCTYRSGKPLRHPKTKANAKVFARRCRGIPPLRLRSGQALAHKTRKDEARGLRSRHGYLIRQERVFQQSCEAVPYPKPFMRPYLPQLASAAIAA